MKKRTGIWLDFSEANIITLEGESASVQTILSEIEHQKPKGGSRSKSPWGPMDKISESKFLARRKQQERAYFEKILEAIDPGQALYLFGPAEAKMHFQKILEDKNTISILGVDIADAMTKNQKIAKVKSFFQL